MTANQIAYWRNKEDIRSHQAQERETNRANTVKEAETKRHNVRQEELTLAETAEKKRHNLETEDLAVAQFATGNFFKAADIVSKFAI